MPRNSFGRFAAGGLAGSVLLTRAWVHAEADGFSLKLEPGVAIPLTDPQAEIYDVGPGLSMKALFGLTSYLDIGPTASFIMLAASEDRAESGVVWGLGGGLRLKPPRTSESSPFSPWADADMLYVRSGDLHRPGFDVAGGLAVGLGQWRNYWVGPFVRYTQVIQPKRAGYNNDDAKLLSIGLSIEFGGGIERPTESQVVHSAPASGFCPDADGDGVPDSVDRCADAVGTVEGYGCPNYERVVVKPDKLELKEHVYFAWDSAKIEPESHPALDEVVQALKDHSAARVQLEGHADATGTDGHNQPLSEQRAEAVKAYLVARGVAPERLVAKGFSSSSPTGNNSTVAGREGNRRVEFVVQFIVLNDGSSQ